MSKLFSVRNIEITFNSENQAFLFARVAASRVSDIAARSSAPQVSDEHYEKIYDQVVVGFINKYLGLSIRQVCRYGTIEARQITGSTVVLVVQEVKQIGIDKLDDVRTDLASETFARQYGFDLGCTPRIHFSSGVFISRAIKKSKKIEVVFEHRHLPLNDAQMVEVNQRLIRSFNDDGQVQKTGQTSFRLILNLPLGEDEVAERLYQALEEVMNDVCLPRALRWKVSRSQDPDNLIDDAVRTLSEKNRSRLKSLDLHDLPPSAWQKGELGYERLVSKIGERGRRALKLKHGPGFLEHWPEVLECFFSSDWVVRKEKLRLLIKHLAIHNALNVYPGLSLRLAPSEERSSPVMMSSIHDATVSADDVLLSVSDDRAPAMKDNNDGSARASAHRATAGHSSSRGQSAPIGSHEISALKAEYELKENETIEERLRRTAELLKLAEKIDNPDESIITRLATLKRAYEEALEASHAKGQADESNVEARAQALGTAMERLVEPHRALFDALLAQKLRVDAQDAGAASAAHADEASAAERARLNARIRELQDLLAQAGASGAQTDLQAELVRLRREVETLRSQQGPTVVRVSSAGGDDEADAEVVIPPGIIRRYREECCSLFVVMKGAVFDDSVKPVMEALRGFLTQLPEQLDQVQAARKRLQHALVNFNQSFISSDQRRSALLERVRENHYRAETGTLDERSLAQDSLALMEAGFPQVFVTAITDLKRTNSDSFERDWAAALATFRREDLPAWEGELMRSLYDAVELSYHPSDLPTTLSKLSDLLKDLRRNIESALAQTASRAVNAGRYNEGVVSSSGTSFVSLQMAKVRLGLVLLRRHYIALIKKQFPADQAHYLVLIDRERVLEASRVIERSGRVSQVAMAHSYFVLFLSRFRKEVESGAGEARRTKKLAVCRDVLLNLLFELRQAPAAPAAAHDRVGQALLSLTTRFQSADDLGLSDWSWALLGDQAGLFDTTISTETFRMLVLQASSKLSAAQNPDPTCKTLLLDFFAQLKALLGAPRDLYNTPDSVCALVAEDFPSMASDAAPMTLQQYALKVAINAERRLKQGLLNRVVERDLFRLFVLVAILGGVANQYESGVTPIGGHVVSVVFYDRQATRPDARGFTKEATQAELEKAVKGDLVWSVFSNCEALLDGDAGMRAIRLTSEGMGSLQTATPFGFEIAQLMRDTACVRCLALPERIIQGLLDIVYRVLQNPNVLESPGFLNEKIEGVGSNNLMLLAKNFYLSLETQRAYLYTAGKEGRGDERVRAFSAIPEDKSQLAAFTVFYILCMPGGIIFTDHKRDLLETFWASCITRPLQASRVIQGMSTSVDDAAAAEALDDAAGTGAVAAAAASSPVRRPPPAFLAGVAGFNKGGLARRVTDDRSAPVLTAGRSSDGLLGEIQEGAVLQAVPGDERSDRSSSTAARRGGPPPPPPPPLPAPSAATGVAAASAAQQTAPVNANAALLAAIRRGTGLRKVSAAGDSAPAQTQAVAERTTIATTPARRGGPGVPPPLPAPSAATGVAAASAAQQTAPVNANAALLAAIRRGTGLRKVSADQKSDRSAAASAVHPQAAPSILQRPAAGTAGSGAPGDQASVEDMIRESGGLADEKPVNAQVIAAAARLREQRHDQASSLPPVNANAGRGPDLLGGADVPLNERPERRSAFPNARAVNEARLAERQRARDQIEVEAKARRKIAEMFRSLPSDLVHREAVVSRIEDMDGLRAIFDWFKQQYQQFYDVVVDLRREAKEKCQASIFAEHFLTKFRQMISSMMIKLGAMSPPVVQYQSTAMLSALIACVASLEECQCQLEFGITEADKKLIEKFQLGRELDLCNAIQAGTDFGRMSGWVPKTQNTLSQKRREMIVLFQEMISHLNKLIDKIALIQARNIIHCDDLRNTVFEDSLARFRYCFLISWRQARGVLSGGSVSLAKRTLELKKEAVEIYQELFGAYEKALFGSETTPPFNEYLMQIKKDWRHLFSTDHHLVYCEPLLQALDALSTNYQAVLEAMRTNSLNSLPRATGSRLPIARPTGYLALTQGRVNRVWISEEMNAQEWVSPSKKRDEGELGTGAAAASAASAALPSVQAQTLPLPVAETLSLPTSGFPSTRSRASSNASGQSRHSGRSLSEVHEGAGLHARSSNNPATRRALSPAAAAAGAVTASRQVSLGRIAGTHFAVPADRLGGENFTYDPKLDGFGDSDGDESSPLTAAQRLIKALGRDQRRQLPGGPS